MINQIANEICVEDSSTLVAQNKRLNKQIKIMFAKSKKEIDKNTL
jgi:hypothetical protein